jgi:hypothetical protein
MLRRVNYRAAGMSFFATGLWFILGLLLILSPVPNALGILSEMFGAWVLLFCGLLGLSGGLLTLAAFNGMFPVSDDAPPAAPARTPQRRPNVPENAATERLEHGPPLPWTQSPLPSRRSGQRQGR